MSLGDQLSDARQSRDIFSRILDTNGDGTGTKNAIGDYSSVATPFKITCPANSLVTVHRMLVLIRDTGAMAAEEYGAAAALANGIEIAVYDDTPAEVIDLTDGVEITTNAGWGRLCYDVDVKTWSTGDEILLVRYTFSKSGQPLNLAPGWSFRVILNDDHTNLVEHYFTAQGVNLVVP